MKKSIRDEALRVSIEMNADPDFVFVWSDLRVGGQTPDCGIYLKDGGEMSTLITAKDVLGNHTVMLLDGSIRQYLSHEVA